MNSKANRRNSLKFFAAAVGGIAASLSLAGTAHADVEAGCTDNFFSFDCAVDILPGLHCDRGEGFATMTTCTNATKRDYTVIDTVDCPEASYTTSYNAGTSEQERSGAGSPGPGRVQ